MNSFVIRSSEGYKFGRTDDWSRLKHPSMSNPVTSEFDVIFAGGGTTACVVAGRLAAWDPSLSILILEGGQHTLNQAAYVQPYRFTSHFVPTSTTMTFNVGNPSPRLNGRAPIVRSAHCIGGGSSVNTMSYTRAAASDFDDWGVDGWESKNLIPLMKKLETYEVLPNRPTHGYGGPIKVSYGGCKLGVTEEFIRVGTTYHKRKYVEDTDDLETCNTYIMGEIRRYIDGTTGRRSDAAHHYIYNQAHNANLQIWVGKRVKRVIFQDKRAVGVEFTSDPVSCPDAGQSSSIVRASKLVVVSAGAFGSPAILERSGIGAEAILKRCDIQQVVDLPGVGENYRDHNIVFLPYFCADGAITMDPLWRGEESVVQENLAQWKINGKSLIAQNGTDAKIKWRPDDDELKAMGSAFRPRWKKFFQDRPDKAVAIFALSEGCTPRPPAVFISNWTRTGQEGIDFNTGYLDDPSDIVPLNFGYKKMREIFRRMPSYRGEVPAGHPCFPEGSAAVCRETTGPVDLNAPDLVYTAEDDEAIDRYNRDCVQTTWHSLGTCAMKPRADQGVVDARLNVYGVTNLKVADMSIAPKNVGTNTYSTALLIGEKAAMIIADELGIECRPYNESS
ncbi:GMC oxidoreductase-domain-containing protein [Suillus subluteus]|nr:GMC oxidoreductase-domain-containing protein [Suillus subluteus]